MYSTYLFNQNICKWNVSNMFKNAISFNQNISNLNVSNITSMQNISSFLINNIKIWNL